MTEAQKAALVNLLWEYMKRDPEHKDRVRTAWGTKTKEGLCACIERITLDNRLPDSEGTPLHTDSRV